MTELYLTVSRDGVVTLHDAQADQTMTHNDGETAVNLKLTDEQRVALWSARKMAALNNQEDAHVFPVEWNRVAEDVP